MRIEFCGANRTVTGSSHLIEINGKRILLDCGMYQGKRELARQLNTTLPNGKLDAVILSHGHLDHCGKLPFLIKQGYNGPIHCTPATADLARIVLLDSAEIQEEDAAYLNRRARDERAEPVSPLYVRADVHGVLRLFKKARYNTRVDLGNGVGFTFFDAGHVVGSAYVILDWSEPKPGGGTTPRTLLFTADIGRRNTPILRDPTPLTRPIDYIITESTYGGRQHAPVDDIQPQLREAIQQIVRDRSRLILPAFAVGRTQTILWYYCQLLAKKEIPPINIYVDSPMGVEVSQMTTQHQDVWDDETIALMKFPPLSELSKLVKFASSGQQSREINNDRGPCIIVASSPTCEFGRVLHHLKQSVEDPKDIIVFTGWIPPQTLGRRLQDGEKRVRIHERFYDVRCQVRTLHGLSAHADGDEMMQFLRPAISPTTDVHVVHGEADQAEAMARKLLDAGAAVANVPAMWSSTLAGAVAPIVARSDSGDME